MQRAEINIPGNPGIILRRVAPVLSAWFGPDGYVLGGGTVLAARWQHRVSTDIDLFTDHERYQQTILTRRDEVANALSDLVAETGEGAVEVERGWLRVLFPEGPAALMTIPRPTIRDPYVEHVQGTNVPTESTAEILARKVQSRILDLGVFTDRDLYDLLVAQQRAPEPLNRVLASITAGERAAIASELRGLPTVGPAANPSANPPTQTSYATYPAAPAISSSPDTGHLGRGRLALARADRRAGFGEACAIERALRRVGGQDPHPPRPLPPGRLWMRAPLGRDTKARPPPSPTDW